MYTERIEKFSFKNFLVMLLTIALIVVFILWLLPNKKSNNKKLEEQVKEEPEKNKEQEPTVKKYEYKLIEKEEGSWSDWSNWQLEEVEESDVMQVEINKVNKLVGQVTKIKNGKRMKEDVYSETVYYRYRTYTITKKSKTITKWSSDSNDLELLNDGYTLTGNVK